MKQFTISAALALLALVRSISAATAEPCDGTNCATDVPA
jgi:hypothetical protein